MSKFGSIERLFYNHITIYQLIIRKITFNIKLQSRATNRISEHCKKAIHHLVDTTFPSRHHFMLISLLTNADTNITFS